MMRSPNTHKYLRLATFVTENCDDSNTWQLAVSADGGSYVNVGSAVSSNGHQTVRPVSGGAPLSTVAFHNVKPRLTQTAASSTAPPQIRGPLEVIYDERPDMVEEVFVTVLLGQRGNRTAEQDYDALESLADHSQGTPVTVRLPGESAVRYGFVVGLDNARDITGDQVRAVDLRLVVWETS